MLGESNAGGIVPLLLCRTICLFRAILNPEYGFFCRFYRELPEQEIQIVEGIRVDVTLLRSCFLDCNSVAHKYKKIE